MNEVCLLWCGPDLIKGMLLPSEPGVEQGDPVAGEGPWLAKREASPRHALMPLVCVMRRSCDSA